MKIRNDSLPARAQQPWVSWLSTSLLCVGIWGAIAFIRGEVSYFWPFWVIGPWGIFVLAGILFGRYNKK